MKIGFLGAGNMARAIATGLLERQAAAPAQLSCIGGQGATARRLAGELGIRLAESRRQLIADSDAVILAFKPQHLETIGPDEAAATRGKFLVSILAGRDLASLRAAFGDAGAIVRVMPNTPSRIGRGVSPYCVEQALDADRQAMLDAILAPLGKAYLIPESQMHAATAIAGCGPALYFQLVDHLAQAADSWGLPRELAAELAAETGLGALELLRRTGRDPQTLTNEVVSPNGVTHALLESLREQGWQTIVNVAIGKAVARSRELANPADIHKPR